MLDSLNSLFQRDLDKLEKEISSYVNEADLWVVKREISNSAGNLALHICGNLQHFIGKGLGKSSYERNREFEFNANNVSREDIISQIELSKDAINTTFSLLSSADLKKTYPIELRPEKFTTEYFLLHLAGHLNYHLGQVNYHRRLI